MTFEIVDSPGSRPIGGKFGPLTEALLALPPGKSIRVPLDAFRNNPAAYLKTDLRFRRKLHTRRLPDGLYLWLEPAPATNGNGVS